MSLTVRYPNGQAITYNDAHFVERGEDDWNLYANTSKKTWIASIQGSAGVIVEATRPCMIENPTVEMTEQRAEQMVADMYERPEGGHGEYAERIRVSLRRFYMRTWQWPE